MNIRRLVLASALLIAAGSALAARQAPAEGLPPASEIIAKHVAAIGGEAAFKSIKSVRLRGTVSIKSQDLNGVFDLQQARPNKTVLRIDVPSFGTIQQGYDGKIGWGIDPQTGPVILSGRELEEQINEAFFDGPLFGSDYVKELTVVERTEFNKLPAYKVKVVYRAGPERFEYFDIARGLHIGSEGPFATANGVFPMKATFEDYRSYGPIKQIGKVVQRVLGLDTERVLTAVDYNGVPASAFELPKAIKALAK